MRTPTFDTNQTIAFLDAMFGPSATRHLIAIPEDGKVSARSFAPADRGTLRKWVEERQCRANLYYSVNEPKPSTRNRKARKQDIARALHLHVDVDDAKALDWLRKFAPKPTAVVFSGGGYQGFWKLREPSTDLARVERINLEIARQLGGDKCQNIDRIMRLPGTVNVPNTKKRNAGSTATLAYIVEEETDWSRLYSLSDFEDPTPAAPASALHVQPVVIPVGLDQLPRAVSPETRQLIELGDDLSNPIGTRDAHFPSRSEAVWRVACDLARADCAENQIAGALLNSAHGISRSVLEKKRPADYASRQARQALAGWDCALRMTSSVAARRSMERRSKNIRAT
jgi:hypothetical protein